MKQLIEITDLLDSAFIDGFKVKHFLEERGLKNVMVERIKGEEGYTDFIKVVVPGKNGKFSGGKAPTLGIIGRLGGIGARPALLGLVSDADGAIVALTCALKLADMRARGDLLEGDVIVTTHICPSAPTKPHKPVPFMGSPVDIFTLLEKEVDESMDAILSVDATKGNRIIKVEGFAITPTVKEGWILKVSDDLIDIYERVTGKQVAVVPITLQDITPYGTGIYHINSMMQPWLMTSSPVVGVAITAKLPIAGCATGATYITSLEAASRFCIEVAKEFTAGKCKFYDEEEYEKIIKLFGKMDFLRKAKI